MEDYMYLSNKLSKKQIIEKILLELVYEFLILDSDEMKIAKVEDVKVLTNEEYLEYLDEAIDKLNKKTRLNLSRDDKKIYMGKSNK